MSNFYLNQLKLNSDFDKSALLLWVFHVDKKAPHAGISFNEKYLNTSTLEFLTISQFEGQR